MNMIVKSDSNFRIRYFILVIGIIISSFCLFVRLTDLHVVKKEYLQAQCDARTIRIIHVPSYRGIINDRYGEPLAISTPINSIFINKKKLIINNKHMNIIANLLQFSDRKIIQKINIYEEQDFLYLQRHIIPFISNEITALNIPGIYIKFEYQRYYPTQDVSSQVLGFTNIDDTGIEGIEQTYNDFLNGQLGQKRIVKDRLGREIEFMSGLYEKYAGENLELSLDRRLQNLTYRELKIAIAEHQAKSGCALILYIPTSEVLAMVNQPTYNPNTRRWDLEKGHYRNRAVTDNFEPASTIKPFSMTSVLEYMTTISTASHIDTAPGYIKLLGGMVQDIKNNGLVDLSTVLMRSSNVGVSKLVLNVSGESLWETYDRFGFGYSTESNFPGENSGLLLQPNTEQPFMQAIMAFGYGITVTPMQLARAYAILGTGGVKRKVSFLKQDLVPKGIRVLSESVTCEVASMLSNVVESKRSKAKVTGYHVSGKTGTARKVSKNGYEQGRHQAVYGGLAPTINPQFAIVITINEPNKSKYYSNQVAAPVFSRIASGALRLFNIPTTFGDTKEILMAQNGNILS